MAVSSQRDWWAKAPGESELFASQLVVEEAAAGDAVAAKSRLEMLASITIVTSNDEAMSLTEQLLNAGAVPRVAADDAAHIAIAVTNGADDIVTWNFRHIGNVDMQSTIKAVCEAAGYKSAIICSPDALLGE